MNIKSLLLGSAAALAVVSGAQAADAVVAAEPEPMEYVKVCDAYGTGYFYIPGTETCLKIGGRVRFDLQAANSYALESDNGWRTKSRAEIYMDSASDTEYGALKTQFVGRLDFNGTYNDGAGTSTSLVAANISLAGFTVGLTDSLFTTMTGYAGDIINDDVVSYGQFEVNQINYVYDNGAGLKVGLGLEADDIEIDTGKVDEDGEAIMKVVNGEDYIPNVTGGVGYTAGSFGVAVVGGYDERLDEGAIKGRVDGNFGAFSAFVMAAWSSSGNKTNNYAPGDASGAAWGDWAAWAGVGYKAADNLGFNAQIAGTDNDTLAIAANVKWNPVAGLLIQPEVTYSSFDNDKADGDQWNGMIRFQRTF
ncbi:porin [Rhizobium sp. FKL33]|uniref:porin n=1 Tax=Rhizobium sp. FKL33 TaxID=2562307 RepID=UPI0010C13580|nr:porin [Rhizobium sp. FKL33]